MLRGEPYGHGVDWWALGIMVFEMLTGCPPFNYESEDTNGSGDHDDDNGDEKDKTADDEEEDGEEEEEEEEEEEDDDDEGGGGGGEDDGDDEDDDDDEGVGDDGDDDEEEGDDDDDDEEDEDDDDDEDQKLFDKIIHTEADYPDDMSLTAMSFVIKVSDYCENSIVCFMHLYVTCHI